MSGLIVPAVARSLRAEGPRPAARAAIGHGAFGAAVLLPWFLLAWIAPALMMRLLYGADSPYVAYAPLLRLLALNYAIMYVAMVLGAWLLGLHQSRLNFAGQVVYMAATLLIPVPATLLLGLKAMMVGAVAASCVNVVGIAYFLRRAHRATAGPGPAMSDVPALQPADGGEGPRTGPAAPDGGARPAGAAGRRLWRTLYPGTVEGRAQHVTKGAPSLSGLGETEPG
jgi:hypothetical protein